MRSFFRAAVFVLSLGATAAAHAGVFALFGDLPYNEREVEAHSISVRKRSGEDLGVMTVAAFVDLLQAECAQYSRAQ